MAINGLHQNLQQVQCTMMKGIRTIIIYEIDILLHIIYNNAPITMKALQSLSVHYEISIPANNPPFTGIKSCCDGCLDARCIYVYYKKFVKNYTDLLLS